MLYIQVVYCKNPKMKGENQMKNNKGITLISLTVTVFILLLLASTLILSSRGSYSIIKVQNFISKMKIIQAKVDELNKENADAKASFKKEAKSKIEK